MRKLRFYVLIPPVNLTDIRLPLKYPSRNLADFSSSLLRLCAKATTQFIYQTIWSREFLLEFLWFAFANCPSEVQDSGGQPGYQHVLKLAEVLVEIGSLSAISNSRVNRRVTLWERLSGCDKQRVVYHARRRDRQPKGSSEAARRTKTFCPGRSLHRWGWFEKSSWKSASFFHSVISSTKL